MVLVHCAAKLLSIIPGHERKGNVMGVIEQEEGGNKVGDACRGRVGYVARIESNMRGGVGGHVVRGVYWGINKLMGEEGWESRRDGRDK